MSDAPFDIVNFQKYSLALLHKKKSYHEDQRKTY